jgi:hypothetical protein
MSALRNDPIAGGDAPRRATAAFLGKLSKHLALIGCLMVVGAASGREPISQLAIFLTIVIAALLHGTGCYLRQRMPRPPRRSEQ